MGETAIIIFLLAAVAVVAVIAAVLVVRLHRQPDEYVELSEQFEKLQADHTVLQTEKAALEEVALGYLAELKTVKEENTVLADEVVRLRDLKKDIPESGTQSIIPEGMLQLFPTNKFTGEPYLIERDGRMVDAFKKNSEQSMLQEDCATDPETGIRYYIDSDGKHYFCAALGGAFGTEIGIAYQVTLENGYTFPVITADFRHPIDAEHEIYALLGVDQAHDYGDFRDLYFGSDGKWHLGQVLKNYDGEDVLAVIEFVVDMRVIPHSVRDAGTFTVLEKFGGLHGHGGNVKSIKKLGRWWAP